MRKAAKKLLQLAVRPARQQAQQDIVSRLKELLERAERGELETLAYYVSLTTSAKLQWGSVGCDTAQVVGRLEIIKHSVLREWTEGT